MRPDVWSRRRRSYPRGWGIPLLLVTLAIAASLSWFERAQPPLVGRAEAVDGDTLRLDRHRIRLAGLDAPELGQTCTAAAGIDWSCGARARAFLSDLLRDGEATCSGAGHDHYGRILATCVVAGRDVGGQLVAAGWAISEFGYPAEEAGARDGQRGIWSGSFVSPAEWRRTHGDASPGVWEWIRSWFQ